MKNSTGKTVREKQSLHHMHRADRKTETEAGKKKPGIPALSGKTKNPDQLHSADPGHQASDGNWTRDLLLTKQVLYL